MKEEIVKPFMRDITPNQVTMVDRASSAASGGSSPTRNA
jgi:hypothetical protein